MIRGEGSADIPEEGAFAGEAGSMEVNHQKSIKGKYPESKSKKSITIDIDTYQQKNFLHPEIQTLHQKGPVQKKCPTNCFRIVPEAERFK